VALGSDSELAQLKEQLSIHTRLKGAIEAENAAKRKLAEASDSPEEDLEKKSKAVADARADVVRARFDFDAAGHYSRPDIFRLDVSGANG
jgi:hypothetical protein